MVVRTFFLPWFLISAVLADDILHPLPVFPGAAHIYNPQPPAPVTHYQEGDHPLIPASDVHLLNTPNQNLMDWGDSDNKFIIFAKVKTNSS